MCVQWWADWRDLKVLPYGGTDMMEQPAYVLEAIKACQTHLNQHQSELMEQQRKDIERQTKKAKGAGGKRWRG